MLAQNRKVLWYGVASMVVGCAVAVFAQRANPTDPDGSFAALVAEIRQLRVAIEQSTRSQTQTQALAVYLSTQQSRLVQVAGRLDSTQKELSATVVRSRELAVQIAGNNDEMARTTDAKLREVLEDRNRVLKRDQPVAELQEQQARSREIELSQILQAEDARWADLIAQLEQLIKK